MFRGIGFRHALATAQLLFFLAVMIPYQYQLYERRHPAAEKKSDVGWDLTEFGPPEWVQACEIVNAPAVIACAGIGIFVPERLSWIVVALMGAGIFLQWYFVGLWRDISAGNVSRDSRAPLSRVGRILLWLGLFTASVSGLLAIAAQVFYFKSSNSFLISLAIWCGFFAAFLLARIRGWDASASDGLSLRS
jgi:hypothetical protein